MQESNSRNPIVTADFRALDYRRNRPRHALAHARDTDATADFTPSRELAFLANVLIAGCSFQSRPFTPQEASEAAASICKLGLEYCTLAIDHDPVIAFEIGWSALHRDVSLFPPHSSSRY